MGTALATTEVQSLPALIDRAAGTLAGARTAAEVLEARDMASVAYDAAKRAARFAAAKGAFDELIAKVYRAQADALTIEAEANRRLADEYDAAQERGEVRSDRERTASKPEAVGVADIGLSHKDIHEARILRDAEVADPGIIRRTVDEAVAAGEEPTKAKVRRAALRTVRGEPEPPPIRPARGRDAICGRVRDAFVALSGLPPAAEVVGFLKGTDDAIIVGERMLTVHRWIDELASLWGDDDAD